MKNPRSKTPSPEAARIAASLLAAFTALVVVTCSAAARRPAASAAHAVGSAPSAMAGAEEPGPSVAPAASSSPVAPAEGRRISELRRFHSALHELEQGRRTDSVRVLWMGDSHAAADFWPDAVRKPLQARFGAGGPGFIYLGLGVYRHAGMKVVRDGKWRVAPRQPSLWTRQDDGIFGLGGIRVVPDDAKSRMELTLSADAVRGGARWDLAFRLPSRNARLRIAVQGGETRQVDSTTAAVGVLAHLEWRTKPGAAVVIDGAVGEPELFGIVVESERPGVVVDTLGINGARIATPLAWDAEPWLAEARRRSPSLFILAYGTNEVGDRLAPHRYGPELESLVARVRQAAPDADCLVVGPTDREGPGWTPLPRVAEIEAVERQTAERLGCGFWSARDAMGGEGSLRRWADQSPPLAASDHVHLTPRGYEELGRAMAESALALTAKDR